LAGRSKNTRCRRLGGSCARTSALRRRTITRPTRWCSSSVLRAPAFVCYWSLVGFSFDGFGCVFGTMLSSVLACGNMRTGRSATRRRHPAPQCVTRQLCHQSLVSPPVTTNTAAPCRPTPSARSSAPSTPSWSRARRGAAPLNGFCFMVGWRARMRRQRGRA
jgi:hypothetical protein